MASGITYTQIQSTTMGSNAASVTLSSIPSTYTDLILVAYTKDVRSGVTNTDLTVRVNGDTGSNYSWSFMSGSGSGAGGGAKGTNQSIMYAGMGSGQYFVPSIYQFFNYANTSVLKSVLVHNNAPDGGSVRVGIGMWRSTSAINSITLIGEQGLVAGTVVSLYGIKAA